MALNVPVFFTRLGSAVVFCAIMILGLRSGDWAFYTLFFIIHLLCLREYGSIVEKIFNTTFSKNEKLSFICIGVSTYLMVSSLPIVLNDNAFIQSLQKLFFYFFGLFIGWILLFFAFSKHKEATLLLTGIAYISFSFGLFTQVHHMVAFLPLAVVLLIWCNDTFAYLVGSFIGKTPFAPSISPKKTIEGTLGGIVLTIGGSLILKYFFKEYDTIHWISLSLIVGIVGTVGDLIESKLKRMAGIKDSGTMMPGHGGAFDRFDSLILVIPFVFLYTILFLHH